MSAMNEFQTQRFGKYLLLDRIAVGGMAEVFRGKITGEQGFEKLVVIKKMLPHLTADRTMVEHFVDEAKLAALFQHENIVHVYDFGEIDGGYFIAMEYLTGKDLKFISSKLAQAEQKLPLDHILQITANICEGLDYAHNLKDLYGTPLNFVHRDVSPQNIYVTYDGKIKILDFGIAKTVSQGERTQVGTIKGKVAYMSPEQAASHPLDRRSDVFSVGILLYEMMSGRRMFDGETYQVLTKVADADFRAPEEAAPGWPDAAYRILHKALAKAPEDRYPSCREMRDDIDIFRRSQSIRPTAGDLSAYMLTLFAEEYAKEQTWVREVLKRSQQALPLKSDPAPWIDTGIETVIIEDAPSAAAEETRTRTNAADKRGPSPSGSYVKVAVAAFNRRLKTAIPRVKSALNGLVTQLAATRPRIKLSASLAAVALLTLSWWWWSQPDPQRVDQASATASVKRYKISPPESAPPPQTEMRPETSKKAPRPEASDPVATSALEEQPTSAVAAPETMPITVEAEPTPPVIEAQPESEKPSPPPTPETGSLPSTVYYPSSAPPTSKTERAVVRHKVRFLLAKATEKLNQYQLTTPPNNCAFYYYQKVLDLDPGNQEAKLGFIKIADRYAYLAQKEMDEFRYSQADHYIRKGLEVDPGNARLLALNRESGRSLPGKIFKSIGNNFKKITQ
jgi:serine/threonine protein kinase